MSRVVDWASNSILAHCVAEAQSEQDSMDARWPVWNCERWPYSVGLEGIGNSMECLKLPDDTLVS
jgi:hypothetical protein